MVLELFRHTDAGLDRISQQITRMLSESRHVFDEAMSALLAGADPDVLEADIYETDRRINQLEQEIRRELIVHTSVKGTTDITSVMVLLMVSRKIERIGDNAKNIYDLVLEGIDLSGARDLDELRRYRDEISGQIAETADIFAAGEAEQAEAFMEKAVALQQECDEKMHSYLHLDEPSSFTVPRALLYRYAKRIVAQLEGIVSAVVNPFDLIDYSPTGEEIED